MTTKPRLVIFAGSIVVTFSIIWQVLALTGAPAGIASPAITPTATSEPPVFTATLSVAGDRDQVNVGDILTMTVDLTVSEGCQYPLMELTLKQTDGEPVIFDHVDPTGDLINNGVTIPSVWTFRATQPGIATFDARSFGERYCGDFWNWHYSGAKSEPVTVHAGPFSYWIPINLSPSE